MCDLEIAWLYPQRIEGRAIFCLLAYLDQVTACVLETLCAKLSRRARTHARTHTHTHTHTHTLACTHTHLRRRERSRLCHSVSYIAHFSKSAMTLRRRLGSLCVCVCVCARARALVVGVGSMDGWVVDIVH